MNLQLEFFHLLAQPVTALRVALELELRDAEHQPAAHKTFEECLNLVDRLAQDLAIFREIASLEAEAPIAPSDGETLLKSCLEEMEPVAQACGVGLELSTVGAQMLCGGPILQRAMFILLDEMIACAPQGGAISIRLSREEGELRLELRPGAPVGRRQLLCRKLLECAGGSAVEFDSSRTVCTFREGEYRQKRVKLQQIRKF